MQHYFSYVVALSFIGGYVAECHFQQYFTYIVEVGFNDGKKPEYMEKTSNMPQVTEKHYHIMLYRVHPAVSGNRTRNVGKDGLYL